MNWEYYWKMLCPCLLKLNIPIVVHSNLTFTVNKNVPKHTCNMRQASMFLAALFSHP